ncbi:MAG TPA: pyridoxamine 5'-phosphate oxidase family protein [Candidatus Binatia bacterium]|nr:pyridoxamine 5'-phosphate oxidase family protein [Candidatus Binatia bacterium]
MDVGETVRKLIEGNRHCVLATASASAKPEAALINYASQGMTLYFETMRTYRKYANLGKNALASVVITELPHTLQMDGLAEELSGTEADKALALLIVKLGKTPAIYDHPDIRFFAFKPTWARLFSEMQFYDVL